VSTLRRLYLYSAVQNFANSLYGPFVSFVAASTGVPPLLLGVVSSAGTVFNNVSAFLASFRRWRPLELILLANAASAIALVLMATFAEVHVAYAAMYAAVMASLGVSGYGWSLIMEQYSRERRGASLAEFSFYSTLGGLVATLITGFLIQGDPLAIRFALYAAAALMAANTAQLYRLGVDYREGPRAPRGGVGRRLLKFYVDTFIFMVTWSFAWPLFPLAQVYIFHMTGLQVAILQIITVASNLAFQRAVGRFVDRHMRLSLFLGRATFMTWPLVYGIATNVYQIYAAYLFFGFGGSISNIAYFAYVVDNAEDRRKAIGYFNLVNALGAATGAELSSAMLAYVGNYGEEFIRRMLIGAAFTRLGSSLLFLL
jgi:MFS family permease